MESIKTSPNVEFDVIYADGIRRRVLITSGTIDLVKRAAMVMPHLFEGTGFNPLNADAFNIVAITRPNHDILHRGESVLTAAETQAIFRQGQMDMRESAAAKLRNAAANLYGITRAALESAADLVEEMETFNSDAGQEELNAET